MDNFKGPWVALARWLAALIVVVLSTGPSAFVKETAAPKTPRTASARP